MENFTVVEHPLLLHNLAILRNKNTGTQAFREAVRHISTFLCYEAMRDFPVQKNVVQTPLCHTTAPMLHEEDIALVPILRAGLGMVDGVLALLPHVKVGHIGLYRNEDTLRPVSYYHKLPPSIASCHVFLLDPMLATGGSAIAAVDFLKEKGVQNLKFLCVLAAPEGVQAFHRAHADVPVYCGFLDEALNEHGYIVPGLGDAGDRIFGTI